MKRFIKDTSIVTIGVIIGAVLTLTLCSGCASAPDRTGQHLVTEWYYVSLDGTVPRQHWQHFSKHCKYTDGVIVNVAKRDECPVRWINKGV